MKIIKLWGYWVCHAVNFLKQMSKFHRLKKESLYISNYKTLFQLKIFPLDLLKQFIEDKNLPRHIKQNKDKLD